MIQSANLTIPNSPGTYVLVLNIDSATTLTIGKLGHFTFESGAYLYIGSAHGSGGLRARVNRHLNREKRLHWHIDTLTINFPIEEVWYEVSSERLECRWAQLLAGLDSVKEPVVGFGSSDCSCTTHLLCVTERDLVNVWEALDSPTRLIMHS